MFCVQCGMELPNGAKFCVQCGTKVESNVEVVDKKVDLETATQVTNSEPVGMKKKMGDGLLDTISSKLAGKKIETIRVSMEEMLELLKKHYISKATTDAEYKEIQKTVNGAAMGVKSLTSKDGNYKIVVQIVMQLRGTIDVLHPGDSNWIRLWDNTTGKVYQYSSLTWGKFKKAVKEVIEEEK